MTNERSSWIDWNGWRSLWESGSPSEDEALALAGPSAVDAVARAERPVTFSAGERVADRYVVERFLARGGMGEVYLVHDQTLDDRVALKTPLATIGDDARATAALLCEVRLARRVAHPNVCRVFDVGVQDQRPREILHFATMEYLEGERLGARARRGMHELPEILSIACQLLAGLSAMHRARVLHRDLKSDNILLVGSGTSVRAVITDFGLARELDSNLQLAEGELSGSAGYMAPEQLLGQALSPQTDLFAFGVVLYEMLTGRSPFPRFRHGTQPQLGEPPQPPVQIPRLLQRIVRRCLRVDPRERHPSAVSLLHELESGLCTYSGSRWAERTEALPAPECTALR